MRLDILENVILKNAISLFERFPTMRSIITLF